AIAGPVGRLTFRTIVAGEALLAAGITVGALWAAEAWGRYWAWDPKETWALVTSLVYAAVLASWGATAKRPELRRAVVALAFLAVVFTWWGVNRLGGLHAY
ncbi:cytochrome c biogenesis protein CcsA, partial [uncultured Duncaniella sp.]|uniref:cytochrome c biogenesis protein CcsA n=1 Tax=uncultured Duncaniella sp. TaxID=2768039 RepID=UPI00265ACD80